MIWSGEIGNVTEVHAWTDRPIWPQGLTEIPPAGPGSEHARLGPLAGRRGTRGRSPLAGRAIQTTSEDTSTSPSIGAAFTTSAAARSATWPVTFWERRTWLCNSAATERRVHEEGRHERVSCSRRSRLSDSTSLPAARCRREALLVRRAKETPQIEGVPEGELLGDLPRVAARTGGGGRPSVHRRTASSAVCSTTRITKRCGTTQCSDAQTGWQSIHRRQGHAHDGNLWRQTRLLPVEK